MSSKFSVRAALIVMLVCFIAFAAAVGASAATTTKNDVTLELMTSKNSYTAEEEIYISVVVTNDSTEAKTFAHSVELPADLQITEGDAVSGRFALGTGYDRTLSYFGGASEVEPGPGATEPSTEVTDPSTEATEPSNEVTDPSTGATEPSTEVTDPSTEATEPSQGESWPPSGNPGSGGDNDSPSTGDSFDLLLWLALAAAAFVGIVYMLIKRRGFIAMIALILCIGMLVPLMVPLRVNATSEADNCITVSETITVDSVEYTVTATVSYESYTPEYTTNDNGVKVYQTSDGSVMFEAEDTVLEGQGHITVEERDYASNGKVAYMAKAAASLDDYSEALPAQMSFKFVADQDGTYAVWARNYASAGHLSTMTSVNGAEYVYTRMVDAVPQAGEFAWTRIAAVKCEAGDVVEIRIRTRHAGSVTDKFIVTNNITYAPEGEGTIPDPLRWDKVTEFNTETYDDPVVYPTAKQHPRVMFTSADIPMIHQNMGTGDNAAALAEFSELKETEFDGMLPSVVGSNYNADNLMIIEAKAFDYAINKNSTDAHVAAAAVRHGEEAITAMINFLQTVSFTGSSMDYRYIGTTLFTAAEVYDWCWDLTTDEEKDLIIGGAQIQASMSEMGFPPSTEATGPINGHPGEYELQQCWLAFAIAVADEYPSIYDYVAGMYFDLYVGPKNAYFVSETQHQGSAYGTYRFDADLWGQWLIYQMTGGDNDLNNDGEADGYKVFVDETANVIYRWIYARRPDGKIMTEGDDYEMTQTEDNTWFDSLRSVLFSAANFYNDPVLYQELLRDNKNLIPGSAGQIYSPVMILALNDPTILTEAKEYGVNTEIYNLPLARYFGSPYGGMIARTGWDWDKNSNDAMAVMTFNQMYVLGHQHRDTGSFQLYYKGLLSGDSGYYVNMWVDHDVTYYKSSIAHNTLSISSANNPTGVQNSDSDLEVLMGTAAEGHELRADILGYEYGPNIVTPEYSYMSGDIAGAYDQNVLEAVRSMLFLNLYDEDYPAAFIVLDQIKTNEVGSTKTFLLHSLTEPVVDSNKKVITITNTEEGYNGRLTDQILYIGTADAADADYTVELIGGEGKEFWVNGANHPNTSTVADTMAYEPGWGRVEISTTTAVADQTDYMLNVMYVNDADGSTELVPATMVRGEGIMGAQIFDHVAMFNMDGNNRISDTVTFTIPESDGYTTFKVNVAGVRAGTWTVNAGSTTVDCVASENGGMLYFEATAGEITISYKDASSDKTFDDTVTEQEKILVWVNNKYIYTHTAPEKSGETYLVPFTDVFRALEANIAWEGNVLTADYMGRAIQIDTDAKTASVNDTAVDVAGMKRVGDEVLVPLSAVDAFVGNFGEAYWNELGAFVYIKGELRPEIPEETRGFENAIQVVTAYANDDSHADFSSVERVLDNNTISTWATSGYEGIHYGLFDFGEVYNFDEVQIMLSRSTSRIYTFDILYSVDGVDYVSATGDQKFVSVQTETDGVYQKFDMPEGAQARYVKLVGYGNSQNQFVTVQEMVFIGTYTCEHTYDETVWVTDEEYHWHGTTCGHDQVTKDKAAHVYDDDQDDTCNTCEYVREIHIHTYDAAWAYDATYHWHPKTCDCAEMVISGKAEHSYGTDNVCTDCGLAKPFETVNGELTLQAEDVTLMTAADSKATSNVTNNADKPATVLTDNDAASGGKTVLLNALAKESVGIVSGDPAHVSFSIVPSATGKYYIWVKYATTSNGTVLKYVDGMHDTYKYQNMNRTDVLTDKNGFCWVRLDSAGYDWTAGSLYMIRLRGRTGGVALDEFIVTNDASFDPSVCTHTFSEGWSYDTTNHWHAATCGCEGVEDSQAAHTMDGETCTVCGYNNHEHTYEEAWTYDDTHHWHAATCGCAGEVSGKEEHTYGTDNICVCGQAKPFETSNGSVMFEAEAATINPDQFTIVEVEGASGGSVAKITAPTPEVDSVYDANLEAGLTFTVKVDQPGNYHVWSRNEAYTTSTAVACVKVSVNGADYEYKNVVSAAGVEGFEWNKMATNIVCQAGDTITVRIRFRRNFGQFDKFLVTNSGTYTPVDMGGEVPDSCFETSNGSIAIEAEDTTVDSTQFTVVENASASGGKQAQITYSTGTTAAVGKENVAGLGFTVKVDQNGTYYIWIKTARESTSGSASIYAYAELADEPVEGAQYAYNAVGVANSLDYTWQKVAISNGVTSIECEAGDIIDVRVRYRHVNGYIDKFIVTNNAEYDPNTDETLPAT